MAEMTIDQLNAAIEATKIKIKNLENNPPKDNAVKAQNNHKNKVGKQKEALADLEARLAAEIELQSDNDDFVLDSSRLEEMKNQPFQRTDVKAFPQECHDWGMVNYRGNIQKLKPDSIALMFANNVRFVEGYHQRLTLHVFSKLDGANHKKVSQLLVGCLTQKPDVQAVLMAKYSYDSKSQVMQRSAFKYEETMRLLVICSQLISSGTVFVTKGDPLMVPVHSIMDTLIVIIQMTIPETRMQHNGKDVIVCPRGDGTRVFTQPKQVGNPADLNKRLNDTYKAGVRFAFGSM